MWRDFCGEKAPKLRTYDTAFVANFYGHTVDQYVEAARALGEEPALAALEMNISCPNIQEGGIQFGTDPASVYRVTRACRDATTKPLWVKLSPNAADVTATAKAAQDAGADALTCINTMPAMAIDVERREFRISNKIGGLSGPALKPIAVRIVYQVTKVVTIPVVGIGGRRHRRGRAGVPPGGGQGRAGGDGALRGPPVPLHHPERHRGLLRATRLPLGGVSRRPDQGRRPHAEVS